MHVRLRFRSTLVLFLVLACVASPAAAQSGFDDDRVMLQGYYWESHRHGHPGYEVFGQRGWYTIVRDDAETIADGRFDLIWLPPPSDAGEVSAGYAPKEYFNLGNSYGSFDDHRAMLEALLGKGIEPIADLVLNHRDGSGGWATFSNPAWGLWAITRNDEAFHNPASGVANTPLDQRGADEEAPTPYGSAGSTTYPYDAYRDVDHTNGGVRRDLFRYLLQLKSLGYRGWRYDMVHGFHARWVAEYNRRTAPTFSVGEYDWDKQGEQRGWVWHTATTPGDLRTSSSVFDFTTQFTLEDNKDRYLVWYGFGHGLGLMGDTTDGRPWKQRAVTFLENHDTGYRTNPDGTPEKDHKFDSFQNTWEVEQAYAYILTHPGVPCVYWKHYFDWGQDLQNKIRALVNARKVAGVHSGSELALQDNARSRGVYAARVTGRAGDLYVRVGGTDADWQPSDSGFADYREYATGAGWRVWVRLPGNPAFQRAPRKPALPVPAYRPPESIAIPDEWLNP